MIEPLNIEFYNLNDEIWMRSADGQCERITEEKTEIVAFVSEKIQDFYPKAYQALEEYYSKSKVNVNWHRFLIVKRFIRCNFGIIDDVKDIDISGSFKIECVPCPLRGECRLEGIVCRPEFNHNLSTAELRVMKLWYQGDTKESIAEKLYLSVHTVNNHIRNAYFRLGMHTKAEFVRYAESNNLFS